MEDTDGMFRDCLIVYSAASWYTTQADIAISVWELECATK